MEWDREISIVLCYMQETNCQNWGWRWGIAVLQGVEGDNIGFGIELEQGRV